MAVSRRLRFEILRRDGHTCRYCGDSAPAVKLTVDHVIPTTLGGTDDPSNLTTACQPCNAGKSSIAPDAPHVTDVAEDALRWSAAMRRATDIQRERTEERNVYLSLFDDTWRDWRFADRSCVPRPDDWALTIGRAFDVGFDIDVLCGLVADVLPRKYVHYDSMWRYFCAALRNVLRERQEIAADLIAAETV